jgi:hypothetical protein
LLIAGVAIITAAIDANATMMAGTRRRTNAFICGPFPRGMCIIEPSRGIEVKTSWQIVNS